jgi:uncharacterized protein (DUF1778 family)
MSRRQPNHRHIQPDARLELRATPEQKCLIACAAALRDISLADFVVASAQQAAANTIREFELTRNGPRKVLTKSVLKPRPPRRAQRSAHHRYKKQLGL